MATRTEASEMRASNGRNGQASAFNWGSAGALAGVALGGAALAFAANLGRKMIVESMSASDHWAKTLATEHEMVLSTFDKALAAYESQTKRRAMLLAQDRPCLDKLPSESLSSIRRSVNPIRWPTPKSSSMSMARSRSSSIGSRI